jgi:peptidoglycan/LPS O-acetylase OafA/YrhL
MKEEIKIINLLRGLAALMVCFYHFSHFPFLDKHIFNESNFILPFSELCRNGVYIFFVLSGFIIPFSLNKLNYSIKKIPKFLWKRFLRIEIPFVSSIFLIIAFGFAYNYFFGWPFEISLKQFIHNVLYVVPFSDEDWLNIIYWTLAVEFQFYLLISLLFLAIMSKNNWIKYLSITIFLGTSFFDFENELVFDFASLFTLGIVLFLFRQKMISLLIFVLFSFACCAIIMYKFDSWIMVFLCSSTVLLILFVEFETKLTNFLGEISYSLYLIHGVVGGYFLYMFAPYFDFWYGNYLLIFCMILFTILCSTIFWFLVEKPSKKLSKKVKID